MCSRQPSCKPYVTQLTQTHQRLATNSPQHLLKAVLLAAVQGARNLADTLSGSSVASSISSRSSGHCQLQHSQPSAEWRLGGGSMSGSTVESSLALFAGKKVLLVEVCDMVRLQQPI